MNTEKMLCERQIISIFGIKDIMEIENEKDNIWNSIISINNVYRMWDEWRTEICL